MQDLQVNHAQQSVYYQQQTVHMLAQISQQIASIGSQVPLNDTLPLPYPPFYPSAGDCRVNVFWLVSLVCSLSATLLSALIQQWVRVYMRVSQRSGSPLKKARIRQYFFEGVERLPAVAEFPPGLVHLSLVLFLLGLGDAVLRINTTVGLATAVPIVFCGYIYLYSIISQIRNPQSPYRNPFLDLFLLVTQNLRRSIHRDHLRSGGVWPVRMEEHQEKLVMQQTEECKARDVHAVQWLVDNIDGNSEMEAFIGAISGFFSQHWGRKVWEAFSVQGNSQHNVRGAQLTPHFHDHIHSPLDLLHPPEGTTVDHLCKYVQDLFGTYNKEGQSMNKEAQRKRIRGCIEAAASLVCCTNIPLGRFGEVGEVLSEVGHTENINDLSTIRSNPSFAVRWTCLSLVAFRQMVIAEGNKIIRELAGSAVSGIARFQFGYVAPDGATLHGAQRIDHCLKTAWEHVEDLHRAFGTWDQNRTGEEIRAILGDCESQISGLEHITNEAHGINEVDWRISLLQYTMDEATHKLTRRLPGLSFTELKTSGPILISEAFNFPLFESTPIPPQFIFPGQQLEGLSALGRGLRDIIEDLNPEKHVATVESLESVNKIPIPLRRLGDLVIRQLWRLQDLRDGCGLGFTIEIFFLALRQLSSTSSSPELKQVFYIGTFKVITSDWEKSRGSSGTHRILLNLICDLVIPRRGAFSDFSYPEYIVDELLKLVKKMIDGQGGSRSHIDDAVRELQEINPGDCMDETLRTKVLKTITSP